MAKSLSKHEYYLIIQNSDIYNHFFNRMIRIVLSQIGYKGFTATMDRRTTELNLLRNGSVAIGRPKGCNFWITVPYTSLGYLDIYNYPSEIRGYGKSTIVRNEFPIPSPENQPVPSTVNIEFDEWEILYDNPTLKPMLPDIKNYAKLMYEIYQTLRSNLRQQRTPYIVLTDSDTKLSYENFMMKVDGFESVLTMKKGSFDPESITTLDTKTNFYGIEMMDLFDRIWDMFQSDFGMNPRSDKRERMNNMEVSDNMGEAKTGQDIRLIQRNEALNRLNELHDFAKYNGGVPLEAYMLSDLRDLAKSNMNDYDTVMKAMNKPDPLDRYKGEY